MNAVMGRPSSNLRLTTPFIESFTPTETLGTDYRYKDPKVYHCCPTGPSGIKMDGRTLAPVEPLKIV